MSDSSDERPIRSAASNDDMPVGGKSSANPWDSADPFGTAGTFIFLFIWNY